MTPAMPKFQGENMTQLLVAKFATWAAARFLTTITRLQRLAVAAAGAGAGEEQRLRRRERRGKCEMNIQV